MLDQYVELVGRELLEYADALEIPVTSAKISDDIAARSCIAAECVAIAPA